ncbi:ABC transporter permease [Sporomusa acidovorans]|uniref:ABC transmembrane type-1 domain-containing protein n=1 Tax=Sporomusa acidovorans (strain ATCC 49682 / DSM 3132 / Mol) TaxID=1123286 RepID=A0ABZ3IWV1_SPOA4|nr:ABC transporter permease subunit [Sporomusa acidovorans]OZC23374.1 bicarbonate transport system permease protein CmpB [Sporomusa acidovorans DSM 3132]SDE43456.1 NitT/TauT family transport system permease protein [Sporomusa acidovorans]
METLKKQFTARPIFAEQLLASGTRQTLKKQCALWAPVLALVITLGVHMEMPNQQPVHADYYTMLISCLTLVFAVCAISANVKPKWCEKLSYYSLFITVVILLTLIYEIITLKEAWLPLPFFPSLAKILEAYVTDWKVLLKSVAYSLRLLVLGYFIGMALGIPSGLMMGWYRKFGYWLNPVVRIIGPIPATAWIPVILVAFPTSFSGSVFLIALSVWFPVTVMTCSGVCNINKSYFEIARTLGADERYQLLKIALPGAAPTIFVGMFMGLGGAFATLIAAEMLGVKAGLGWYINWAQGWAEYYKLYAALGISAFMCSGCTSLLFKVRDRVLIWQKGTVKW